MKENKDILKLETPAEEWRDAWPTGNGKIGALVSGNPHHETIIFNHEKHWLYGEKLPLPDVSGALKEVRDMIKEKDYKAAHDYHRNKLHEAGYKPKMSEYSPVFTLEITDPEKRGYSGYSRTLNMETGETRVNWYNETGRYQRQLFVSRHSGNVHCRLSAEGSGLPSLNLKLSPLAEDADQSFLDSHNLFFSRRTDRNSLEIKGQETGGKWFGGALFISTDGETKVMDDHMLQIQNAYSIDLELEVYADCSNEFSPSDRKPLNYEDELSCHTRIHGELYNRIKLNLAGDELRTVQQMFDYGRYLLISSAGSQLPPNLQGVWNGDNHPIWNCFYMLNENVQMMHWQILPGNMPELMHSLFEYYEGAMNDFRENAAKLFGCRGIFIPADTVPGTGLLTDLQGHLIYWTGGAAWLCRLYFDYYLYTGDQSFLKDRALPLMKEAADFYEDYTFVNKKGEIEFCPSISPENSPEIFNLEHKMDSSCNISINAAMDIALCKELLRNLITGSHICGINKDSLPRWEGMLKRLPAYTINKDGAICEWIHDDFADNYHHRHVSHIYPFFPGNEITRGDEMIRPIETAVDKRLEIGMREQTGWSVVHLANIYARLGRGDRAMECLAILEEYCTGMNLFTYHNDWRDRGVCMAKPKNFHKRVFQIDANLGYPAAVMEMLVNSRPGKISLLPGLPSAMKEGEIKGLLCRGNILLNMNWSERSVKAMLKSRSDQTIEVELSLRKDSLESVDMKADVWHSIEYDLSK